MTKITETFELYGKTYSLTTGELAKQATGSVVVSQGETVLLLTAVVATDKKETDFFPLTVDFIEKMYAVGRIPGGYQKREARPSDKGTLTARMIDRPIRTSFPEGFKNEVHIVATTLVCDQINQPDVIGIMGASAALMVGGVPIEGPLAGVRIGRDRQTGEFLVNPTFEEEANSDLELVLAGTPEYICMVEGGADELNEETILAAMNFGQKVIGEFCEAQQRFIDRVAPMLKEYPLDQAIPGLAERIDAHYDAMSLAIHGADKLNRENKVAELKAEITATFSEEEQSAWKAEIADELQLLEKRAMRTMILQTGERIDGRKLDEIRPVSASAGVLPRTHGSGLFTRGQTQVLAVLTLGMLNEWQRLDTIDPAPGKRYMHHYNFPPYSTGETGYMGAPRRREIGHGRLAERALEPVLPNEIDFPYSIRIVSEVLESNGSSSMASACASSLALMDAGVNIKRPVSGIAMGLIKEGDEFAVLSDIQGLEDFLGDMDFKICGTEIGITSMQMDNKAKGLTVEILAAALSQAKHGRDFILTKMSEAITRPRSELSDHAPRILSMQIPVDKIRDVIGSGGKVIRGLQEETGATIEITEEGIVYIASKDTRGEEAKRRIELIVKVPEVGEIYTGKVVSIQSFGAFIELLPGKDGLLHISRVADGRIGKVEDVLSIGDEIRVKIIEIDENEKISLDRLDKPKVEASRENREYRDDQANTRNNGNTSGTNRRRRR
ncbi:MAG: polyribonucleotide nucleotidyltransferase [Coriobacteriia bacterium]|nr:polyribonucleotide nucleotidyltransferase [Coriobacteriia bacterium]